MGKKYGFKYIVIGSGPAGSATALALAKAKKSVALVEGRFFGGANLNTRDVPYAVALNSAHNYYLARISPEFSSSDFSVNLPAMINRELKASLSAGANSTKPFEDAGISCIKGYANFLDNHTIAVGKNKYTAERFILATGAKLDTKNIVGTDSVSFLTPETAIRLRKLPKVALIVGAGSTGVEIAEYYAKLGVKVILMEAKSRILPREDEEVSLAISDHLTRLGVMILPGCQVVALEQGKSAKHVIFKQASTEKMIKIDCIILATGSKPALDYGLENAGIKYKETGILINNSFETSAKNIYAIGDCINNSPESSTDRATYEGLLLASNLTGKSKSLRNYTGITRVIKTNPEVATVGQNETDLIAKKIKSKKTLIPLSEITASKIGMATGFVKLLADPNNKILGATIVAPNADSIITEIALAMRHRLSALELAATPHSINSYNYAVKLAAKKLISAKKTKYKKSKKHKKTK